MVSEYQTDVLVIGGGPAGIGAAIGAARSGAKVLMLERHAFCGGVGAWGMGMPVNQMRPGEKPRGAVHELLIERVRALGRGAGDLSGHALVCNVEYLKVAILDALDAAGVEYRLHARVIDAIVEGDRVGGAVMASKQGAVRVHARCVVDASGDADLAYFAGAATLKGREDDGFLSPMTLCLLIANVQVDEARAWAHAGGFKRLIEAAHDTYPLLPPSMLFELAPFPIANCLVINHAGTRGFKVLDGTSVDDLTEAERFSRRQALQIVAALREFGPAATREAQLAGTGPQVGVRETRRIKGEYLLTEQDAKTGARFEDAIAFRSGFLDIGFTRYEQMKVHDVPYRALLPERMEHLLAAGRCISATHVAASAGKSMGNCMASGHAAGVAAAMSVSRRCSPRELPVGQIQATLRAHGVPLGQ